MVKMGKSILPHTTLLACLAGASHHLKQQHDQAVTPAACNKGDAHLGSSILKHKSQSNLLQHFK
jgi:hypothetical protein